MYSLQDQKNMKIPGAIRLSQTPKAPRPSHFWVVPILLFLGLMAFLYEDMPFFSSTTEYITSSIELSLQKYYPLPSFCTETIGEEICCQLRLEAEPCLDECRKLYTNRQTFEPTKSSAECEAQCLVVYQITCGEKSTSEWETTARLNERSTLAKARHHRRVEQMG
jgi:hypothetical protein